jgi:hypothetical protein
MKDNKLDKNNQNEGVSDVILNQNSGSTGLKSGKNALNLAQCQAYLDKLPGKTKVKIKITNFESYREFLPFVNKYSAKFEVFKYQTDFDVITKKVQNDTNKEMATFKESLTNYLKNQKIDPTIMEILQKEIE